MLHNLISKAFRKHRLLLFHAKKQSSFLKEAI